MGVLLPRRLLCALYSPVSAQLDIDGPRARVQISTVEVFAENETELVRGEHPDCGVSPECDECRNGEAHEDGTECDPLACSLEGRLLPSKPWFVLQGELLLQTGALDCLLRG